MSALPSTGSLAGDLLNAVPASALRILISGEAAWQCRDLLNARNPAAAIENLENLSCGLERCQADAVILDVSSSGKELENAIRGLTRAVPEATLALFAAGIDDRTKIDRARDLVCECGLILERTVEAATHKIFRFVSRPHLPPPVSITGISLSALASDPLTQSVSRVRMEEPFEQLNSLVQMRCTMAPDNQVPDIADPTCTNILIIQRPNLMSPTDLGRMAKDYITIADIDDLPSLNNEFEIQLRQAVLGGFHAIQTSTPALRNQLLRFNPEIAVFDNHLPRIAPASHRPAALPLSADHPLRILFAAINREAGWQMIADAYRRVVSASHRNVLTTVVGDRAFFDTLQPLEREFRPLLAYPDYLAELKRADIVLLPLADTPFDRCKTDLKFIEAAESGAAVLASDIVYQDSVEPGTTGLIYHDAEEFSRHLRALIEDGVLRNQLAVNAKSYVRQHRALAYHVQRRYDWYHSLMARRPELEARRYERYRQISGE